MNWFALELAALIVSLIGGFFIACGIFRKLWKDKVTTLKLSGFTITFLISFFAIMWALGYIISKNVPFTR